MTRRSIAFCDNAPRELKPIAISEMTEYRRQIHMDEPIQRREVAGNGRSVASGHWSWLFVVMDSRRDVADAHNTQLNFFH